MRILLTAGCIPGALIALSAAPAAAQTSNPIQTIELPPSVSVASDPFARVDDADIEVESDPAATSADEEAIPVERVEAPPTTSPALAAGAAAAGNTGVAVAGEAAAEESAVGRVDAIMEMLLGPSEEEQRAVAAKLYAEQAERHALEMQRADTLNREARERVDAENTRRLADYRAEVERQNAEHAAREQARMSEWRARVAACEAGDRAACR